MSIKEIDILNIMVFESHLNLSFGEGINVLIGENGVGKTTILKMLYAATQMSMENDISQKTHNFDDFFSNNLSNQQDVKNSYFKVSDGRNLFEYNRITGRLQNKEHWTGLNIPSVFVPTTEMLSHAKGFLAMNQKYKMPFDETQIDVIVNASLPETREISASMKGILDKISKVIDGIVVQEEDTFYVIKNDGKKIEFSLEAEGLRKLGLLWKLIRNGLLEKDTVLLWDEPETNLNPELYPLVAEILLELQKNGVQIFVATHSYNFAKYLEIRREKKEQVMFHNLCKSSVRDSEKLKKKNTLDTGLKGAICSFSAYELENLEQNPIMIADIKLLDEVYEQ